MLAQCLSGCSAKLTESSFIAQDKTVQPIKKTMLDNWQQQLPTHQIKQLEVETTDHSAKLQGLYLDNPLSDELIFFIQGNGMKISQGGFKAAAQLAQLNKDIVIFDHRGVGSSSGQANIATLMSDAQEEYQFIHEQLKPTKIYLHGYSLGSFIAARLSTTSNISALILQGSATNVDDWIASRTPWYTKPFLSIEVDPVFNTIDNGQLLQESYSGPLLIIAGENDKQAPVELSQKLFDLSQSSNKKFIKVHGAEHQNMLATLDVIQQFKQFISAL